MQPRLPGGRNQTILLAAHKALKHPIGWSAVRALRLASGMDHYRQVGLRGPIGFAPAESRATRRVHRDSRPRDHSPDGRRSARVESFCQKLICCT